jgi:hypothetical protein
MGQDPPQPNLGTSLKFWVVETRSKSVGDEEADYALPI